MIKLIISCERFQLEVFLKDAVEQKYHWYAFTCKIYCLERMGKRGNPEDRRSAVERKPGIYIGETYPIKEIYTAWSI